MHAYTYSIHSLDVLRLTLNYFYLICAILFGLVKGGAPPFPPLGETLQFYIYVITAQVVLLPAVPHLADHAQCIRMCSL